MQLPGKSVLQLAAASLAPRLVLTAGIMAVVALAGCENPGPPENPDPGPDLRAKPSLEVAALTALYNATNGPDWVEDSGWLTQSPVGQWHGVEAGEGGSVIGLDLRGNGLIGTIPVELGDLANLQTLNLNRNQLSGAIPHELGDLMQLRDLRLASNRLTGEIPPELGQLASLTELRLSRNQLRGEIPPELGNLGNLNRLQLDENQLEGEIPPELGDLTALTHLLIAWCRLGGAIPPALGELSKLTEIRLQANRLSGEIPPELGNLTRLTALSLDHNQLSGEIPPELGSLTRLTELSLGYNRISGDIPPELGNLTRLTALSLEWNELGGDVPSRLVALPALADLRLAGNRLSGEIPPELQHPPPVRSTQSTEASGSPAPRPAISLELAFQGRRFDRPIELGAYPVGPDGVAGPGVFVAENAGVLMLLSPGGAEAVELLDISDRVRRVGNEEGLLSVALDPRFEETGHLWLYYSVAGEPRKTRLSRFTADLNDLRRVDPGSELTVLEVNQSDEFHNGGAIRFGPDGMLYLGLGDDTMGAEAQSLRTLWGSIIRIDVRAASKTSPYEVPGDNPFAGIPVARGEIWAYGFRNPWRMAFDPASGVLWAGDVGRADLEEVGQIQAGGNHGWPRFEGTKCINPSAGCDPFGLVPPDATYGHKVGCAVVGGVVYRGADLPALVGHYLFSDYCGRQLWALPPEAGGVVELARIPRSVSSFGVDARGEVYILTFHGAVLRVGPPG